MILFILSLVGGKIKGEKRVENWVLNFLLSDWMYCALWLLVCFFFFFFLAEQIISYWAAEIWQGWLEDHLKECV